MRFILKMLKIVANIVLILSVLSMSAQVSRLEFVENKGQWADQVQFKAKIPAGNLYVEQNEVTYQFYDESGIERLHALHHQEISNPTPEDFLLNIHAFKVKFLNGSLDNVETNQPTSDYVNFYRGNDPNKWATGVKKYQGLNFREVYQNIGLNYYLKENHLKYDFVVQPGGNVADIKCLYDGVDEIYLQHGKLVIKTSVNEVIEEAPYAYQMKRGKKREVKCNFRLEGNILSFEFPRGYDKSKELIIDPTLILLPILVQQQIIGVTLQLLTTLEIYTEVGSLLA